MDVSKTLAAVVSLIVAASLTGTCGAARAAADDTARQTAMRATALAPDARAACAAVTDTSRPAPVEIEHAIAEARKAVGQRVVSDETVPEAMPILDALAARIGPLDAVPSVSLQMLRNALANSAGDTERVIEGRAFVTALLRHIEASGDGTTPATAWQPCLVGNEYAFVQQMLGAREVKQQSLIHEGGRHYDKLELRMADGSTREVFFDVTEVFERNAEALLMR